MLLKAIIEIFEKLLKAIIEPHEVQKKLLNLIKLMLEKPGRGKSILEHRA